LILTVSDLEATAALELLDAGEVGVVPNGDDTRAFDPGGGAEAADVLFVGRMDYELNVDAVLHFAGHAWPIVRERVPGARVVVADGPEELARATVELLRDPARRAALGQGARHGAMAYDWQAIGAGFRETVEEVARAGRCEPVGGAA